MKLKRSLALAIFELAAVLLMTTAAFLWGKRTALITRGYDACGGEYLLLLLPLLYYIGKRTLLDWIADLRKLRKEDEYK